MPLPLQKMAVVNTRRTCMIQVGDGTNTVVTGDYSPFKTGACYVPYAATIVEVNIQSDAGTPSVLLQRRRGAATLADLLSGALGGSRHDSYLRARWIVGNMHRRHDFQRLYHPLEYLTQCW
jgi:hypothetical protein